MKPALLATLVTMALILVIACTNVAALMLGQVEGRATELAVRSALGASRGRITQQLIVEALLLGALAGTRRRRVRGGGLSRSRARTSARRVVRQRDVRLDAVRRRAGAGDSLPCCSSRWLPSRCSGAASCAMCSRAGAREASRVAAAGWSTRLVVAEVALAMLIATGAALLVRSVANRYAIDPGINVNGVAVVDVMASADLSGWPATAIARTR